MPEIRQESILPDERLEGEFRMIRTQALPFMEGSPGPELVDSVRRLGILHPVVVAEVDGLYRILAGRRRVAAAYVAGLEEVPCTVVDATYGQMQAVSLAENAHRSPNPVSDLYAILRLLDRGHSVDSIARELGLSRGLVRSRMQLAGLDRVMRSRLQSGELGVNLARVVAGLPEARQEELDTATRGRRITAGDLVPFRPSQTPVSRGQREYSEDTEEMFSVGEVGGMVRAGEGIADGRVYEIMAWRNERWVPQWVSELESTGEATYSGWGGVAALLSMVENTMPVEPNDDADAFFAALTEMRQRVNARIGGRRR
jgi:ParB/RepB/Spo0J family partition protein